MYEHNKMRFFTRSAASMLIGLLLITCNKSNNKTNNNAPTIDSSLVIYDTTQGALTYSSSRKLSVIVLPPFDKIANEGISPAVQNYLEKEITKDTSLILIPFPYKKLMNVPYQNIFNKSYCKPITDKIDADVIIMSRLEQEERTGQMTSDKWTLAIRIYYPKTDNQINSGITGHNLSDTAIAKLLEHNRLKLIEEIKGNH